MNQYSILPEGLKRLLIGSVAIHVTAVMVAMIVGRIAVNAHPVPPQHFIPTKLVRLGKKRPKHLLPKVERAPPPAAKPAVKLAKPAVTAPQTTEKPQQALSALARAKEMSGVNRALDRLKKRSRTVDQDGDPEGSKNGTVSDAQLAIIGSKFATEIENCMRRNFAVEGVDRTKVKKLEAALLVRVQSDGKLFGARLLKKSGLAAYDRAVTRATIRCGKVSKPPETLREQVRKDGIEIIFKP